MASKKFKKRVKDIIFTILVMGGLAAIVFTIIYNQYGRFSLERIVT